ncbi:MULTISPECIES: ATP-binding protein [Micromonospora]|uniref:ATP-binding protein n=1 Tax=Micromonospora TaxID=1873 RepID=UPI001B374FDB|nr:MULTISPECIES: ATP-binding protein [Micromonospora]MBQ1065596.1 ATP-binding protein [Micromonospora sp. D75]WDP99401.1 ATP-binding protein [Micromonospora chalcea]
MTSTMKGFRCWTNADVRQTVYSDIGALPSDAGAVFLAAHTPMVVSHPRGEQFPGDGSDERQVLGALQAHIGDPDRNTLIAVTGESGAGKSHVVRWVNAHLDPSPRYHVLYVPRAVQTIRDLLRRIVAGLPGSGGQDLMKRIDAAVGKTTPAELQDRLLEEMRLALTWTLELQAGSNDEDPDKRSAREERNNLLGEPDENGKRRDGLADLLVLTQVNRALLRSGGLLDHVVQSIFAQTSRRDEQQERFEDADLPLRVPGVRRELARNGNLRVLWDQITLDPEPALRLLDEALRKALPRTIGLHDHTGETLSLLFQRSRQALRQQGRELVLLFEDLAQFGLVDGELYDQFVIQPGPDMAPLRVLFAVTEDRYADFPETVQTRITHQFKVGNFPLEDRDAFVARYLNLVRLGRKNVDSAWSAARSSGTEDWVPNACDTREEGLPCRFRSQCHAGFGNTYVPGLGEVGLYPYNSTALRRSLEARGSGATPRQILDICVSEALVEAEPHIVRGTYPHERVRERFDFKVQRGKEILLGGRMGDEAERLYRALVIWGDEEPLPPAVAEAFGLDNGAARQRQATPIIPPKRREEPPQAQPSPLLHLFQWQNGERLPDSQVDLYRDILHRLVSSRLDLDQDLFHTATANTPGAEILSGLISRQTFDFGSDARGRSAGAGKLRFELHRSAEDIRVLIAARWFVDHGHWLSDKGGWPWPEGYDPVEMMISLEERLDYWAELVRTAFRDYVGGRDLACAAVGTRAVALLAAGASPDQLRDVGAVLTGTAGAVIKSTSGWARVDSVARDVLRDVRATDLVGQLAAVRQGPTGKPQLIDAAELEAGLQRVLNAPAEQLNAVATRYVDAAPVVAKAARDLLSAMEGETEGFLAEVAAAVKELAGGLEGQAPRSVAQAAKEVGKRALDSHLFRPHDGWFTFSNALDRLEDLPADLPLDWHANLGASAVQEALNVQHWARKAVLGAQDLRLVRQNMAATRRECTHSGGQAGDLDHLSTTVCRKLGQLEVLLQALSTPGGEE